MKLSERLAAADLSLPAVVTFGTDDVQNKMGKIRAELASGAVGHLVHLPSGRHRGYLSRGRPEGHEVTRVSCRQLAIRIGWALDAVRDGVTYEVFDHRAGQVAFYLTWCPPRELEAVTAALPYTVRRGGKAFRREFPSPLHLQAVPA